MSVRGGCAPAGLALPVVLAVGLTFVALLCLASAASANVYEVEPNSAPAQANPLPFDTEADGDNVDSTPDYWALNPAGPGVLTLYVNQGAPCAAPRIAHADNTTVEGALKTTNAFGGVFTLVLDAQESLLIEVCPGSRAGSYAISVSLSSAAAGRTGPDEAEPNDDFAHATPLAAAPFSVRGYLPWAHPDVDVWRIAAPVSGYVAVLTNTTDVYATPYNAGGALAYVNGIGDRGWTSYYLVNESEAVYIAVGHGGGNYLLTVRFGATTTELSQGPDEVEPNNRIEDATVLHPNGTFAGELYDLFEAVDYFRIDTAYGEFLTVRLYCGDQVFCQAGAVVDSGPGVFATDPYSSPGTFGALRAFVTTGDPLVFHITGHNNPERYTVNVTAFQTHAYDDGNVTLRELLAVPSLPIYLNTDPNAYYYAGGPFDLKVASQGHVGPTKCATFDVTNRPQGIEVDARETLNSLGGGRRLVVGNSVVLQFDAPYGGLPTACFTTMFYGPANNMDNYSTANLMHGQVQGNASLVVDAISGRGTPGAGELLALWAVTSPLSTAAARDGWKASNETIAAARVILNASGVGYCNTGLYDNACPGYVAPAPDLLAGASQPAPPLVGASIMIGTAFAVTAGATVAAWWALQRRRPRA